jgi:hypothetical protein
VPAVSVDGVEAVADLLGTEHPLALALGDHVCGELAAVTEDIGVEEVGGALAVRDGTLEDEAIDGLLFVCGVLDAVLAGSAFLLRR